MLSEKGSYWVMGIVAALVLSGTGCAIGMTIQDHLDHRPQPSIEVDVALPPDSSSHARPTANAFFDDGAYEVFPVNMTWVPPRRVVTIMTNSDLPCWIRIDGKLVKHSETGYCVWKLWP